jgi:hypothetical protein
MTAQVNRRTFIGLASGAALSVTAGVVPVRAQGTILLTAEVVTVEEGFQLSVTYALESLGSVPLFIEVLDSKGVDVFFSLEQIAEPSGTVFENIGPFDIPYGRTYLVLIVDASGERIRRRRW